MKKSVSIEGQWIGDLAVQESGDISSVVSIALENNVSVTESIDFGTVVKIPVVVNNQMAEYYRIRGIKPVTSMKMDAEAPGGIGYMAVGINFIVS